MLELDGLAPMSSRWLWFHIIEGPPLPAWAKPVADSGKPLEKTFFILFHQCKRVIIKAPR